MARRTACAIALLALGMVLASPAGAAEEADAPPASGPAHGDGEIAKARWLSYGGTGFGVALTMGLFGVGMGIENYPLAFASLLATEAVFVVGPSLGLFSLGQTTRAALSLVGRFAAEAVGDLLLVAGALGPMGGGSDGTGFLVGAGFLYSVAAILAVADFVVLEGAAPKKSKPGEVEVAPTAWIGPSAAGLAAVGAF